ncbi:unnamed protein product [Sphagnum jensenii]|uniref:Uncharacterized protein n=1 Tax=Sphagnum jensenii TaxID=128206 RepID=A0ABP0V9Y2_9BRYO
MLSPSDVDRIAEYLGYADTEQFAKDHLLASQGAKLARIDFITGKPTIYRVVTLVTKRKEDGSCHFLKDGKCQIHPVSPFGCAMFDSHMDDAEGNKRS